MVGHLVWRMVGGEVAGTGEHHQLRNGQKVLKPAPPIPQTRFVRLTSMSS